MVMLYDNEQLQNLVITGFHVLDPHSTSRKQTIKYRQLITLGRSPALIIIAWWRCQQSLQNISLS